MTHYSPVQDTLDGAPQMLALLGSMRPGETIDRFEGVACALHGHAHRSVYEGRTAGGVPVYNVARPVLNRDLGIE